MSERLPSIAALSRPTIYRRVSGLTLMNLESLLRDVIKPELNGIYTEPPASRAGGTDMGLFCREHAYHVFFQCPDKELRSQGYRPESPAFLAV